jgi:hypothetical protein
MVRDSMHRQSTIDDRTTIGQSLIWQSIDESAVSSQIARFDSPIPDALPIANCRLPIIDARIAFI